MEAPEEPSSVSKEKIMKVSCNISKETNYLYNGIMSVSPCCNHFMTIPNMSPLVPGPNHREA